MLKSSLKSSSSRKLKAPLCGFAASLLALMLVPDLAHAQRAFVAAQGSDSNPCTFTAPCRTFQHAHDTVSAGGEIDVLDPAGYGVLTISKSISIEGHGFSGITAGSGTAITIAAGATDKVNLRGLLLDGSGTGSHGIHLSAGGTLNVQDSVIRGFTAAGFEIQPSAASKVFASNTLISDNGGAGVSVLLVGSGDVTLVLDRIEVDNSLEGLLANGSFSAGTGTVNVTVSNSVFANNRANGGISSFSSAGHAPATVTVQNCVLVNNAFGLNSSGAGATIQVARSTITNNGTGLSAAGGAQLLSFGDNYVHGNASEGAPTGSVGKL